jgi:hypothetical protein
MSSVVLTSEYRRYSPNADWDNAVREKGETLRHGASTRTPLSLTAPCGCHFQGTLFTMPGGYAGYSGLTGDGCLTRCEDHSPLEPDPEEEDEARRQYAVSQAVSDSIDAYSAAEYGRPPTEAEIQRVARWMLPLLRERGMLEAAAEAADDGFLSCGRTWEAIYAFGYALGVPVQRDCIPLFVAVGQAARESLG